MIYLNPVEKAKKIFDIFTSGVHRHLISPMLRLISIVMPEKSFKGIKKYLKDEDWSTKNTAFNEIQKIYSKINVLWYKNEE